MGELEAKTKAERAREDSNSRSSALRAERNEYLSNRPFPAMERRLDVISTKICRQNERLYDMRGAEPVERELGYEASVAIKFAALHEGRIREKGAVDCIEELGKDIASVRQMAQGRTLSPRDAIRKECYDRLIEPLPAGKNIIIARSGLDPSYRVIVRNLGNGEFVVNQYSSGLYEKGLLFKRNVPLLSHEWFKIKVHEDGSFQLLKYHQKLRDYKGPNDHLYSGAPTG